MFPVPRRRLDDACCSAFFFGRDGRSKLTLPKFEAFMSELHAAVVSLEFAHYDVSGRGALSPANFGLSLVAAAGVAESGAFLARVRALEGADATSAAASGKPSGPVPSSYITHAQLAQALLPRLGELRTALTAYDAARGALTPATFTAAVRRICGIQLSPAVVAVVFTVFDADGDGTLTPAEFFDVLERRKRAGEESLSSHSGAGVAELLSCCAACVRKWREANAT